MDLWWEYGRRLIASSLALDARCGAGPASRELAAFNSNQPTVPAAAFEAESLDARPYKPERTGWAPSNQENQVVLQFGARK